MASTTERLLAFAFANADVLLEVDGGQVIQYGCGATRSLFNLDNLSGRSLAELLVRADSAMVAAMLRALPNNARLNPVYVQLVTGSEAPTGAALGGYRLDDTAPRFYLTLSRMRLAALPASSPADLDAETGLLSGEAFTQTMQARLAAAREKTADAKLTLIHLDQLGELKTRAGADGSAQMMEEVGALLRAMSIDGQAAGRLAGDRFGVMHTASVDAQALEQNVARISREHDPSGKGVGVSGATMDLDDDQLNDGDRWRVALYAVRKFAESVGPVTLGSLADGVKEMLNNTVKRVQAFKQILATSRLNVALQPIVKLADRQLHHYEALARPTDGQSPATMVGFAEEIGMTQDFDLLVCQKVIDVLSQAKTAGRDASVAVNLSAVSLDSQVFVKTFRDLVAQYPWAAGKLLIEVTESMRIRDLVATNAVLQELRADGHRICLDDFGAGAASFPYIQALEVDFVKIDGAYVKRVETHPKDRAILKAMVGLCRDLGVGTVAEMVETETQAKALIDLGVDFAQGYLFGRPALDPFVAPAVAQPVADAPEESPIKRRLRRRGAVETWG